jgi:uncharacterized protein
LENPLPDSSSRPCTAFDGSRRIASGPLIEVALKAKELTERDSAASLLTFDDATGKVIDLDLRGDAAEVASRLAAEANDAGPPPGRGRPKLGVVAREVTLLPRHWEWLAAQPGGASAALRRLVDGARREDGGERPSRAAQEAAYRFMAAIAGDFVGFEEASRALFAGDRERFATHAVTWPADVRAYAEMLAWGAS